MPKVSVLLPVFNGELYLREAIESILAQTCEDFELLISDDGSTDSSASIINSFSARDPRIIAWTNPTQRGLFANYNECLARASAEYIKPFAQDDLLKPNALASMISFFEKDREIVLVSCARRFINDEGQEIEVLRRSNEHVILPSGHVLKENLLGLCNVIGEPSAVLFPRQFAGTGFDTSFHHLGDIEYWLRIIERGNYQYCNDILCEFRRHGGSMTTRNERHLLYVVDLVRIGRVFQHFLQELGLTEQAYLQLVALEVAKYITCLARESKVSPVDFISFEYPTPECMTRDFEVFKELLFYSFIVMCEQFEESRNLKAEWDTRLKQIESEISGRLANEHNQKNSELLEKITRLKEDRRTIEQVNQSYLSEINDMLGEIDNLSKRCRELEQMCHQYASSSSWRLTAPIRQLKKSVRAAYKSAPRVEESNEGLGKPTELEGDNAPRS